MGVKNHCHRDRNLWVADDLGRCRVGFDGRHAVLPRCRDFDDLQCRRLVAERAPWIFRIHGCTSVNPRLGCLRGGYQFLVGGISHLVDRHNRTLAFYPWNAAGPLGRRDAKILQYADNPDLYRGERRGGIGHDLRFIERQRSTYCRYSLRSSAEFSRMGSVWSKPRGYPLRASCADRHDERWRTDPRLADGYR